MRFPRLGQAQRDPDPAASMALLGEVLDPPIGPGYHSAAQARVDAGLPASSTSFAFVHAARELGVRRVAVGATYPDDVSRLFADFLRAGGLEVTEVRSSGIVTAAEVGTWGEEEGKEQGEKLAGVH